MEKVNLLFSGYGKFQACSQDFFSGGASLWGGGVTRLSETAFRVF